MVNLQLAGCFLLILLNVATVSSRDVPMKHRHHGGGAHTDPERITKMLVFGDSAADNGNNLPEDMRLRRATRDWYYPYGISDNLHDNKPTGRYSNGLVQSDFLAMILSHEESPAPYMVKGNEGLGDSGMNFAVGDSGVFEVELQYPMISAQIAQLQDMVTNSLADEQELRESVALVAYTQAVDYAPIAWGAMIDDASKDDDLQQLADFVANVTDEIVDCVGKLKEMGVPKVLVNLLPPIGCRPLMTIGGGYSQCMELGNNLTDAHNKALKEKLGDDTNIMLLDLNTVFNDLINPKEGSTLSKFKYTLQPCCEATVPVLGFCGSYENDEQKFQLCRDRDDYFYWDIENPTHAAWRAVMRILQGDIMAFLGISTLNHF
ncbi:hypothetical protein ACP70R_014658 [Stipagrostis hirtigluma subsp. patula]